MVGGPGDDWRRCHSAAILYLPWKAGGKKYIIEPDMWRKAGKGEAVLVCMELSEGIHISCLKEGVYCFGMY